MFAGHFGAGLLLKRCDSHVGLGSLWLGAMLMDCVLWVLVLAGVETVRVPTQLRSLADLTYDFPYSHSLIASVIWSAAYAAAVCAWRWKTGFRIASALIVAAAVFSHFALDWLVHIPELPLAGRDSVQLGFGLWRNLPLAWGLEAALAAAGVWVYLRTRPCDRRRTMALVSVLALTTVMTVVGQASSLPPPLPVMAGMSLVTIALLVVFGWWLERGDERRDQARNGAASQQNSKPIQR